MSRKETKDVKYIEFTDTVNSSLRIKDRDDSKKNIRKNPITRLTSKPNIIAINPNNDLLSRVSAFLPKLAQANEELELIEDKSRFKIKVSDEQDESEEEEDDETGERIIEMNIGIGVLEGRKEDEKKDDIKIWIKNDTSGDSDNSDSNEE